MNSQDISENVQTGITNDNDLEKISLTWEFIRPDNSPEGNSTSWKLRWSPDGTMIAVVYFDDVTVILDSSTGELIKALGTGASAITEQEPQQNTRCWGYTTNPLVPLLRSCAWSPDGQYLAVAGDHKLIEIYNTTTWVKEQVLEGHVGSILSLDWSLDGTHLASGEGTDQILPHNQDKCKYNIKLWDVATGKTIFTLSGHEDSVVSLSWSDNGTRIASASDDRNIKLWDAVNGKLISTLGEGLGHSAGVLDVDWSPNQTLLVSGSRDFKIRLWDIEKGIPLGKSWKDDNCVRSTEWHPSGRYILTAGVDQVIKIRNSTTGKEMVTFHEAEDTNSEVMCARWSPDGNKFASCSSVDATVRLYSLGSKSINDSTGEQGFSLGIPIFFIICAIGIFILYFSLSKDLRKRRK